MGAAISTSRRVARRVPAGEAVPAVSQTPLEPPTIVVRGPNRRLSAQRCRGRRHRVPCGTRRGSRGSFGLSSTRRSVPGWPERSSSSASRPRPTADREVRPVRCRARSRTGRTAGPPVRRSPLVVRETGSSADCLRPYLRRPCSAADNCFSTLSGARNLPCLAERLVDVGDVAAGVAAVGIELGAAGPCLRRPAIPGPTSRSRARRWSARRAWRQRSMERGLSPADADGAEDQASRTRHYRDDRGAWWRTCVIRNERPRPNAMIGSGSVGHESLGGDGGDPHRASRPAVAVLRQRQRSDALRRSPRRWRW